METNNNKRVKIAQGFDVCPSCKGDDWKSAKMVVMEGTTNTDGSLSGNITDPGAFSGGLRNFFLSDRWFSFDRPIEADIGLTSKTGLVEEVRRLMVEHGSSLVIPFPPEEPAKLGIFKKVYPKEPKPPIKPKKPEQQESGPVSAKEKSTFKKVTDSTVELFGSILATGLIVGLVAIFLRKAIVDEYLLNLNAVIAVIAFGTFIWVLKGRPKSKNEQYENELRRYSKDMESYNDACDMYREKLEKYKLDLEKAKLQNEEEEEKMARYKTRLAEYELKKSKVLNTREALWNKARICMRCGVAYLGKE